VLDVTSATVYFFGGDNSYEGIYYNTLAVSLSFFNEITFETFQIENLIASSSIDDGTDGDTRNYGAPTPPKQKARVSTGTSVVGVVGTSGGFVGLWLLYGVISKFQLIGASTIIDFEYPKQLVDALGPVAGILSLYTSYFL
jgi:hypothetical protein